MLRLNCGDELKGSKSAEGDDKASVQAFVARNPGLSRVAVSGAIMVGVVLCGHDGRRGHIYHLAINPKYRARGLAKRLVDECLEGLRRAGVQRAIILVSHDNTQGRQFWKRCGWEELPGALAMGKATG